MSRVRSIRPVARRAGFTLVELLTVAVLGSLLVLSIYQVLIGQEQATREQQGIIDAQQTARISMSVLAGELREISATGGDVLAADSVSVTFRAFRKLGVVCAVDRAAGWIEVWELGRSFTASPADSVLIFADGNTTAANDDAWSRAKVSSVNTASLINDVTKGSGVCPTSWAGAKGKRLTVGITPLLSVDRGGLVRSFDRVTYGLFQLEGEWSLGRIDYRPVVDTVALIGPLASNAERGLRFRYYDRFGNLIADPSTAALRAQISRIEIRVRGQDGRAAGGGAADVFTDSLTTQLALRGNDAS